jgi:hypothetical protein
MAALARFTDHTHTANEKRVWPIGPADVSCRSPKLDHPVAPVPKYYTA